MKECLNSEVTRHLYRGCWRGLATSTNMIRVPLPQLSGDGQVGRTGKYGGEDHMEEARLEIAENGDFWPVTELETAMKSECKASS